MSGGIFTERATGAAALAKTIAPPNPWKLFEIRIHLSAAGAATSLTATMDAGAGAAYDSLMYSVSMGGVTDVIRTFDPPLEFTAEDELDIAYLNAGAATYGLEVKIKYS